MSVRTLLGGALIAACCSVSVCGAELGPAELEKIVADSGRRYTELFAERNAAGISLLFTPEAEYVDATGTIFHGRAAIEAELAASFAASPAGKLDLAVASIRPIADGLIVEEGTSTFTASEGGAAAPSRYMALHSRQTDGAWLLAAVRELPPRAPTANEQLQQLAWLIGDWREEAAGGVTKTSWKWSDDGAALLASFTFQDPAGGMHSGTHRVGWDAQRKQFRSWIFDSEGGFAGGWWSPGLDGTWSVQLEGADAEGVAISAVLAYARDGAEGLRITQERRTRGGEAMPGMTSRVVRAPPQPGKSS